jgi:hypothetical protein
MWPGLIRRATSANSYRRGRGHVVTFSDVDVVVVVEKEVGSDKHPLPYIIRRANEKTPQEIHAEIRRAQSGGFSSEREAIDK